MERPANGRDEKFQREKVKMHGCNDGEVGKIQRWNDGRSFGME